QNHQEEFLPKDTFLAKFSDYALTNILPAGVKTLTLEESEKILGASVDDGIFGGSYYYTPTYVPSINTVTTPSSYATSNYSYMNSSSYLAWRTQEMGYSHTAPSASPAPVHYTQTSAPVAQTGHSRFGGPGTKFALHNGITYNKTPAKTPTPAAQPADSRNDPRRGRSYAYHRAGSGVTASAASTLTPWQQIWSGVAAKFNEAGAPGGALPGLGTYGLGGGNGVLIPAGTTTTSNVTGTPFVVNTGNTPVVNLNGGQTVVLGNQPLVFNLSANQQNAPVITFTSRGPQVNWNALVGLVTNSPSRNTNQGAPSTGNLFLPVNITNTSGGGSPFILANPQIQSTAPAGGQTVTFNNNLDFFMNPFQLPSLTPSGAANQQFYTVGPTVGTSNLTRTVIPASGGSVTVGGDIVRGTTKSCSLPALDSSNNVSNVSLTPSSCATLLGKYIAPTKYTYQEGNWYAGAPGGAQVDLKGAPALAGNQTTANYFSTVQNIT
ncbi:MAG: hypothetical protein COV73_06540, partial [Candidatus Omnitrophica bacterium CG11_big_fil_rev_8_21_14_0_20_43_6]